jgi:ubiquinone/menaquinone biosynthesis C-methylase UbiE
MLEYAKINSPTSRLINANAITHNFPDDKFDIIYACAFIHCFPKSDADLLLKKIHSWLKPNGIFSVSTTINLISGEGLEEKKDYDGKISDIGRNIRILNCKKN